MIRKWWIGSTSIAPATNRSPDQNWTSTLKGTAPISFGRRTYGTASKSIGYWNCSAASALERLGRALCEKQAARVRDMVCRVGVVRLRVRPGDRGDGESLR